MGADRNDTKFFQSTGFFSSPQCPLYCKYHFLYERMHYAKKYRATYAATQKNYLENH